MATRNSSYIGEGTYGCVYRKHLPCRKKKAFATPTVGKVFVKEYEASLEKNIQEIVEKLDPAHEFSLPMYNSCTVQVTDPIFRKELKKCSLIKTSSKPYKQLIYRDGGKDLRSIMRKKGSKAGFLRIFKRIGPILQGIKLLYENGYAHQDIKPANMMFDGSKVYLIDFGIMDEMQGIFAMQNKRVLSHHYPYYPPEFKLFVYGKTFNNFYLKFLNNFDFNFDIGGKRVQLLDLFETVLDFDIKDELRSAFNLKKRSFIGSKVDVYSLGILLFELYMWSGLEERQEKKAFCQKVKALIRGMVQFNVEKRFSIVEAIEAYAKIYSK